MAYLQFPNSDRSRVYLLYCVCSCKTRTGSEFLAYNFWAEVLPDSEPIEVVHCDVDLRRKELTVDNLPCMRPTLIIFKIIISADFQIPFLYIISLWLYEWVR